MKNIILAMSFLIGGIALGQTTKITQLFDKYQNTEGITSIKIAKPMFDLINSLNIEDEDMKKIKPLIAKINSLRIVVLDKKDATEARFNTLKSDIKNALTGLNYEELMDISADGETIKILAQSSVNNKLSNLILSINGIDEAVFMVLEGEISMEEVNGMISNEK